MIRSRVIRAAIANWAGRLIGLLVSLGLTPFILHHLGEDSYGLWILVGSIIVHGEVLDLGVNAGVVKYVAEYRARGMVHEASKLVASALCLYSIVGFCALVFSVVFARYFPDLFAVPAAERGTAQGLVLVLGLQLAIYLPGSTASSVLRGLQRYDVVNAIGITGSVTFAAGAISSLLAGGNVLTLAVTSLANSVLTQALSFLAVRHVAPWIRPRLHRIGWAEFRQLLSFSSRMLIIDAAGRVHTRSNEILIAIFLPIGAVAPYAIAQRLALVPQTLSDKFLEAFFPLASQLEAQAEVARLRALFLTGTRITLAMTVPFTTLLIAFAAPVLSLWIGAPYAQYAPIVITLAVVSLVDISQWPGSTILIGMGRHGRLATAWICIAIATPAFAAIFLPVWGLWGAALGVLIPTVAVHGGVILPYAARIIGVGVSEVLIEAFLPALLPVLPMAVAVQAVIWAWALPTIVALVASALVGVLTYAAGYLLLTIRRPEGEFLRRLIPSRS
jgi:O-antigen/teichoic acid export membrane protein